MAIWSGHLSLAKVKPFEGKMQYLLPQSIGLTEPTTPMREGEPTKVLKGDAPPRGPAAFPFIYHVQQERYPFCIPPIGKWYPFHIPSLELCILFNAVNRLSLK